MAVTNMILNDYVNWALRIMGWGISSNLNYLFTLKCLSYLVFLFQICEWAWRNALANALNLPLQYDGYSHHKSGVDVHTPMHCLASRARIL